VSGVVKTVELPVRVYEDLARVSEELTLMAKNLFQIDDN